MSSPQAHRNPGIVLFYLDELPFLRVGFKR